MTIDVASVAMNAFTLPSVTSRPFPTPQPSPTSAPRISEPHRPTPVPRNALPAMIAPKPEIAPTERSKPPAMNTNVPPTAMIPTGAVWKARFFMFAHVKNALLVTESVTKSATNATTTP